MTPAPATSLYLLQNRATVQPLPPNPRPWPLTWTFSSASAVAARRCGLVGERATAQLLYLAITTRLFDKPVSVGVKGHSSSGKSYVVQVTCRFFPKRAVIEMTAMSQRALVYSKENYRHRTLVLYEVVALREGVEDDLTSYFVRSLLSEGRISYAVHGARPSRADGPPSSSRRRGPPGSSSPPPRRGCIGRTRRGCSR